MTDLDQRLTTLGQNFASLDQQFQKLKQDGDSDLLAQYGRASQLDAAAMSATAAFARTLEGQFDPTHLPPQIQETITSCVAAWTAVEAQTAVTSGVLSTYSTNIVNFRDVQSAQLSTDVTTFGDDIQRELSTQQSELRTRTSTLQTQMDQKNRLDTARDELIHKRDSDESAWHKAIIAAILLGPFGIAAVASARAIYEATCHAADKAAQAARTASDEAQAASKNVADTTAKIAGIQATMAKIRDLSRESGSLLTKCKDLSADVENQQDDIMGRCGNRASMTDYALSKAEYATCILEIVEVALQDVTLLPKAKEIVAQLADHDDQAQTVHAIIVDQHPGQSYLAFLQNKIDEVASEPPKVNSFVVFRGLSALHLQDKTGKILLAI